jgi:CubicO group peptidase (beta-lactamase class C family)
MRRVSTWLLMVPLFCMLSSSFADDHKASKTKAQPSATKPGLDGFGDFVAQALKDWKVPGVAVVQGDKVILRGYGYRDAEKQLPVTPNTLFAIGSITKSFTVTTLGMEMDEPAREYLPTFKMYDPVLTEQMGKAVASLRTVRRCGPWAGSFPIGLSLVA